MANLAYMIISVTPLRLQINNIRYMVVCQVYIYSQLLFNKARPTILLVCSSCIIAWLIWPNFLRNFNDSFFDK